MDSKKVGEPKGRSIEQLGSDAVANSGREDIGGISNSQNMAGLSSFPMSRNVFIVDIPPQDQLDSLDEELCSTGESFNSADSPVPETQSGDGKHELSSNKKFFCSAPECSTGFATVHNLRRHEANLHGIYNWPVYICAACSSSEARHGERWVRRALFKKHVMKHHPDYEVQWLVEASKRLPKKPASYANEDGKDAAKARVEAGSPVLSLKNRKVLESILARELLKDICALADSDHRDGLMHCILLIMPELLQDFLLLLRTGAEARFQYELTLNLERSRTQIVQDLRNRLQVFRAQTNLLETEGMSVTEKFSNWKLEPSAGQASRDLFPDETAGNESIYGSDPFEDVDISKIPKGPESRDFLLRGEEYQWLLMKIEREFTMSHSVAKPSRLRQTILSGIEKSDLSLRGRKLRLDVNWNPRELVNEQGQFDVGSFLLGSTITVTGQHVDAYATTCRAYIGLMWPSFGNDLLQCVEDAIKLYDTGAYFEDHRTRIHVRFTNGGTSIEASGEAVALLEIAEAMSWLGAACRPSPFPDRIATCTTTVENRWDRRALNVSYECTAISQEDNSNGSSDGRTVAKCWHLMFRNPVIALDSPIPRRNNAETGLETTLELLATLAQTFWATCFGDSFLLKGFNSITVPIQRFATSVIWHFIVNKDGTRMPYYEVCKHGGLQSFEDAIFQGARHFVGWTRDAQTIAGTKLAEYDYIDQSDSTETSAGVCAEAAFTISGGKFLNIGFKICRGSNDQPEYLSSNNFNRDMIAASRWGVIMTDTNDCRHWLIDGATAILHLCRASLSDKLVPEAPSGKAEELSALTSGQEFMDCCGPELSRKILMDPQIRALRLSIRKIETNVEVTENEQGQRMEKPKNIENWQNFEDLAREMYQFLQQIHDRTSKRDPNTLDLQFRKSVIVGFDIMDLLLENGAIAPRSRKLIAGAENWLDLSLKLGTINILCSNLGELIKPVTQGQSRATLCGRRATMPVGRDYLAASLTVLQTIIKKNHPKHSPNAVQLADGFYWTEPSSYFEPCDGCSARKNKCSLLVSGSSSSLRSKTLHPTHEVFEKVLNGAIIFGYEPNKLTKDGKRTRKSECSHELKSQRKTQPADSGIDVGSSGPSSNPDVSSGNHGVDSSLGWSIRGAASGKRLRRSQS